MTAAEYLWSPGPRPWTKKQIVCVVSCTPKTAHETLFATSPRDWRGAGLGFPRFWLSHIGALPEPCMVQATLGSDRIAQADNYATTFPFSLPTSTTVQRGRILSGLRGRPSAKLRPQSSLAAGMPGR